MTVIVRPAAIRLVLAVALAAGCSDDGGNGGTTPSDDGDIAGRVTAAGTGVGGATVTLSGAGTGTTTTGTDGRYRFDDRDPGGYTVTLTVPAGFELGTGETAAKPATVTAGGTATVNWTLTSTGGGGTVTTVTASGTTFSPSTVQIATGTTVRWTAQEGAHTVTPDNPGQAGAWQNTGLSPGESFDHTFNTAGTFDYHCQIHAGMNGQVVVQ